MYISSTAQLKTRPLWCISLDLYKICLLWISGVNVCLREGTFVGRLHIDAVPRQGVVKQ